MRYLLISFILYGSFIIQTSLLPLGPDIALLVLVAIALYEKKITATLFGLFIGLCFDLTTPYKLGVNMLSFSIVGYLLNFLRNLLYHSIWQPILFALIGLTIKNTLFLVNGMAVSTSQLVINTALTLLFSLPIEKVMRKLLKS